MNREEVDRAAFAREVEDPLLAELDAIFLTLKRTDREVELSIEEAHALEALQGVLNSLIYLRRQNIRREVMEENDEN